MNLKKLFVLILTLLMLTGCSLRETVRTLDAAEDAVERKLDAAEDAVERKLDVAEDAVEKAIRDGAKPAVPGAVPESSEVSPSPDRLSPETARETALAHAGFTPDQVSRLHTEFEYDDRIPQYDVSFREGHWEYEYEIHAETGEILSWDRDD